MGQEINQLPTVNIEQKEIILNIARKSITAHLKGLPLSVIENEHPFFDEPWGAFVTIYMDKQLRGCIGRLETKKPLFQTIQEISISAATEDPRFFPMREEDLSDFQIKISLLTPSKIISEIEEIIVGIHGVLIDHAGRRGVLLPQVPVEQGWDLETFLQNVCVKAGLPIDTWKKGPKLYTFTSIEFGD